MSQWTYWATNARADDPHTLDLVRKYGLLCRPFFNTAGHRIARVSSLAVGDTMLLCHSGHPRAWFELVEARKNRSMPESPVFEFVKPDSPFGRALAKHGYRADGRYFPLFTAIRVRETDAPLVTPAPHHSRFAIEPFVAFDAG